MRVGNRSRLSRGVQRGLLCLVLLAGVVGLASSPAQAAAGCSRTSNHAGYATYNCYMYRSSVHMWNHWTVGGNTGEYDLADNVSAVLNQGTSWFVCQRTMPVDVFYNGAANNWWAYTLSDNGWWGWVNAVYISGGVNWGPIPGLPGCPAGFGNSTSNPANRAACSAVHLEALDGASLIRVGTTSSRVRIGGVC